MIGGGENLRCRHPADIHEPVAEGRAETGQLLNIAVAVLESDQVRTCVGQPSHGVEFEEAIVAVVDDGADSNRTADRDNMAVKPFLFGLDQIVREQQNPIGARASPPAWRIRSPARAP